MNLGTASDVREIEFLLAEILRVLQPGGKFLLSFYNKDALLYKWEFLPWPVGLAAEINIHKHCLDVHTENEVLSIYARPYAKDEVQTLFHKLGQEASFLSYPSVCAVLPSDLFIDKPEIQDAVKAIDLGLMESQMGAYLVVTGTKIG